jgi:hypothetical protein
VLVFGFFPFENGWNWQGFEFGSGGSLFGTLGVPVNVSLSVFARKLAPASHV